MGTPGRIIGLAKGGGTNDMIYGTLFTMPSAQQVLASTSEYSSPMVTDFLPVIFFTVGTLLGLAVVAFLIYTIADATGKKH